LQIDVNLKTTRPQAFGVPSVIKLDFDENSSLCGPILFVYMLDIEWEIFPLSATYL
jgi:hypothetical protein